MIATYWEANIRKKIASCFNEKPNDVKSDIMADINCIRNDLLHNKGKSDRSAKNKIIKFEKGSTILFENSVLDKIIEQIFKYINALSKQKFGENCYTNNSLSQGAIQQHLTQEHTVIELNK